jgi:hypothetical protein
MTENFNLALTFSLKWEGEYSFDKMLEMQFAKRATSQHGVKGLQQFQKMQRNN